MQSTDRDSPPSDIFDTQDGSGAGGLSSSDIFAVLDSEQVRAGEKTAYPSQGTRPPSLRRGKTDGTDGNDHIPGPSGTPVKKPQSRPVGKLLSTKDKQAIQNAVRKKPNITVRELEGMFPEFSRPTLSKYEGLTAEWKPGKKEKNENIQTAGEMQRNGASISDIMKALNVNKATVDIYLYLNAYRERQAIQPSQAGAGADIPQSTQGGPGTSQPNHSSQGSDTPGRAVPPGTDGTANPAPENAQQP
ncbi:MAG: hypothetical protein KZQ63_13665 [Candidatus Thiodiazotropha sp. (ex Lucinoma aequizonata)]|nr:hypothetical protein [Candidatus Thiodiazotropha sp. (ex Lucinoma aequizonata)]